MTSWIPSFSGFMKRSRTEGEVRAKYLLDDSNVDDQVLGQRSLTHQSKPPLTHVGQLSLDAVTGPELVGDTEILSGDLVSRLSDSLPARLIGADWRLIFSTSTHGFSLSSFSDSSMSATSSSSSLTAVSVLDVTGAAASFLGSFLDAFLTTVFLSSVSSLFWI